MVQPCDVLYAFILVCKRVAGIKRDIEPQRRQTVVGACSTLRAHSVMYTCSLPYQREGDTSQSHSDRAAEIIACFDSMQ